MGKGDIFSLAMAALIGLYSMTLDPWSLKWWIAVVIAAGIAVYSGAHVVWGVLPGSAQSTMRDAIWSPQKELRGWIRGALLGGFLFLIFGGGYEINAVFYKPAPIIPSPRPRPVEAPQPPAPQPLPPPVIAKPPASPLPPWVTNEEITAAQKLGRILLRFPPDEVSKMRARGSPIDAYIGRWVKVSGKVSLPIRKKSDAKSSYLIVDITSNGQFGSINIVFDGKIWENDLMVMKDKQDIVALCQITDVIGQGYVVNLIGGNCELEK